LPCDSFEESLFEPPSASYRKYCSNEILVTFASHRVCVCMDTSVYIHVSRKQHYLRQHDQTGELSLIFLLNKSFIKEPSMLKYGRMHVLSSLSA